MQLVSLQVGQLILGPVLKLVMSHKGHDPRLLVLESTAMNVNSYLILTTNTHTHTREVHVLEYVSRKTVVPSYRSGLPSVLRTNILLTLQSLIIPNG